MLIPRLWAIGIMLSAVPLANGTTQEAQTWSFSGVDRIILDGVSGDLEVRPSPGGEVGLRLVAETEPPGAFRGEVAQNGSILQLEERWTHTGRSTGSVRWILSVPPSLRPTIEMRSSSGDFSADGITAKFTVRTSSGDFRLRDGTLLADTRVTTSSGDVDLTRVEVGEGVRISTSSGEVSLVDISAARSFEFSTSSGDVTVRNSRGVLEGGSSSGDVRVERSMFDGSSSFRSSSGNVTVRLESLPDHDLTASSASGDVRLDIESLGNSFTLRVTKREDRGRIDVPFEFASRETFERSGRIYERRTLTRGTGVPEITLSTASGNIVVREQR